jgi:hypothetical protein
MLTGESMSVPKFEDRVVDDKAVKQDMTNMLFSVSRRFPRVFDA